MAQRMRVELIDDLDGTEIIDGRGETVRFGLDGTSYEIDLTDQNAKQLRKAIEPYIRISRHAGGSKRHRRNARSSLGGAGKRDREQSRAIRDWGKAQGMKTSERGRIGGDVMAAYEAAHP